MKFEIKKGVRFYIDSLGYAKRSDKPETSTSPIVTTTTATTAVTTTSVQATTTGETEGPSIQTTDTSLFWTTAESATIGSTEASETVNGGKRSVAPFIVAGVIIASGKKQITDVYSRMYSSLEFIKEYIEDPGNTQPFFLCEYSIAMGNGPGDVCDYWELIDQHPKLIGGCIWEWRDHTVLVDGVQKYGGDFNELTHNGNFCCDGMVFSNNTLKSGSLEIKTAYQPIRTELQEDTLKVVNRLDFTNLAEYTLTLEATCDGIVFSREEMCLDVEPHGEKTIRLSLPLPSECRLGCYLNVYLTDKTGWLAAQCQHSLDVRVVTPKDTTPLAALKENEHEIIAEGDSFRYVFSKHYGNFSSIFKGGREYLLEPIALTAWRAPVDNDRNIKIYWGNYNIWQGENLATLFSKVYSCRIDNGRIVVEGSLAGISRKPFFRYTLTVTIHQSGRIHWQLDGTVREDCIWLPRLGFEMKLPFEDDRFSYFGKGPSETYCDMQRHALMGWYQSSADDEYVPYVVPQEHGNHTGCKVLKIESGLEFVADTLFDFRVSHYSSKQLTEAMHTDELVKEDATHIRIDYKVSGVGSNACGPELLPKYRLSEKEIYFGFSLL